MSRLYESYTLWMKFRNSGWTAYFTVKNDPDRWPSPIWIIEHWIVDRGYLETEFPYWKRGKNWMILPEGKKPAALLREQA